LLNVRVEEEPHERLEIINKRVHLGLNIFVGEKTWDLINRKDNKKYLRETAYIIFHRKQLPYLCLDPKKVKNTAIGNTRVRLCCPQKLELYLNLYKNYLENRHPDIHDETKDIYIKDATENLTVFKKDLKKKKMSTNSHKKQKTVKTAIID